VVVGYTNTDKICNLRDSQAVWEAAIKDSLRAQTPYSGRNMASVSRPLFRFQKKGLTDNASGQLTLRFFTRHRIAAPKGMQVPGRELPAVFCLPAIRFDGTSCTEWAGINDPITALRQ
jgi:hypothetical protein